MGKLVKITHPSSVSGFKCIGGACDDSCCIGWDIDIDKITFRRYFRTKNSEMKEAFRKHVYQNGACDSEEVDYGRVRIKESKWCPFLNEDKLCEIYSNLGEEYLSNVCYSYPRVLNILDGDYEMSLFMSCPEAARQILLQKEPIVFERKDVVLGKHIVHSYVNTKEQEWKKSPLRYLKELRSFSIDTVQNRDATITERLLKLGHKLEILQELEGPKLFKALENDSKNGRDTYTRDKFLLSEVVQGSKSNYMTQVNFFKEAIESLRVFSDIDSPRFVDYTKKVLEQYQINDETTLVIQSQLYEEAIRTKFQPFLKEHSYMFEHYLVNFIFQGNFPFTENQDMFDGYIMLAARYAFIRFYLAGLLSADDAIDTNEVATIIQVFTKTIDHHKTFLIDLLQELKIKEFDNMEFISMLLL